MTDWEFVNNLKGAITRDGAALERIYSAYFKKLFATALFVLKNRDDAYDAATDVILKLCEYSGDPAAIKNHKAFLAAMARNRALDILRKKSRSVELIEETAQTSATFSDCLWLDDICAVLTEEERDIFVRRVLWDRTLKSIAAECGMPYIRVKRLYASVKAKVKKLYGRG